MDRVNSKKKEASKKKGRPSEEKRVLSLERIIKETENLLGKEMIEKFSMRKLAKRMNVDPMSLYNYFPSKIDLLTKVINIRVQKKWKNVRTNKNKNDIHYVSEVYLDFCMENVDLIKYLSLHGGETLEIEELSELYYDIFTQENMNRENFALYRNVLVDFIHGFSFAGKKEGIKKEFFKELEIILKGIQAVN